MMLLLLLLTTRGEARSLTTKEEITRRNVRNKPRQKTGERNPPERRFGLRQR
jgi:hypothetical protein